MKMLDGSVQFGSGKGQVRCFFKWSDPFSKDNKSSYSAKFEYLSTLYNLGVAFLHAVGSGVNSRDVRAITIS